MPVKTIVKLVAAAAALAFAGTAQARDIKIALISSQTGPLEAYAKQTLTGFKMGLDYLTHGTMTWNGDKIVLISKDDQGKPDVARALLEQAYTDDGVDLAVGTTSSGSTLAMLPVAKEARKILIVEPAVADEITGKAWNRYIFRTARNSSQDALATAVALGSQPASVAVLAQDYAFGHDGVAALKAALARTHSKAKVVSEVYAPTDTTDFTAPAQRLFDALKDSKGTRIIAIIWTGPSPFSKIAAMDPGRYNIELAPGGNLLPVMKTYQSYPGTVGATYYYYGFPKNRMNDWLVAHHEKEFGTPPDFFTCGGMAAASAALTAIQEAGGTDTEKLISAMEGMSFGTPKGRMTFRKSDHQALQDMYAFKVKAHPEGKWDILSLVKTITPDEMPLPVENQHSGANGD
jgi:branched-chain amino acid transport system substrate-binding protein